MHYFLSCSDKKALIDVEVLAIVGLVGTYSFLDSTMGRKTLLQILQSEKLDKIWVKVCHSGIAGGLLHNCCTVST